MTKVSDMRRAAGWVVLGQIALEVIGLSLLCGPLEMPRPKPGKPVEEPLAPIVPSFITEVADGGARYYRLHPHRASLFAGFYSDGRVRLATAQGRRFSGIVVAQKAVVADLSDDVSFEMQIMPDGPHMSLSVNGGPYDGQTFACEPVE